MPTAAACTHPPPPPRRASTALTWHWGEKGLQTETKHHLSAHKKVSYHCVERETRILLHSSFLYRLFSQGKLKTTHWSRPRYKPKHRCGISVNKLVKTKNPHTSQSRLFSFQFNCPYLSIRIHHQRSTLECLIYEKGQNSRSRHG